MGLDLYLIITIWETMEVVLLILVAPPTTEVLIMASMFAGIPAEKAQLLYLALWE